MNFLPVYKKIHYNVNERNFEGLNSKLQRMLTMCTLIMKL
jgi:hypothetical protein